MDELEKGVIDGYEKLKAYGIDSYYYAIVIGHATSPPVQVILEYLNCFYFRFLGPSTPSTNMNLRHANSLKTCRVTYRRCNNSA